MSTSAGVLQLSNLSIMSDSQLRNTISALSTAAAAQPDQFRPYSPVPDGKAKSKDCLFCSRLIVFRNFVKRTVTISTSGRRPLPRIQGGPPQALVHAITGLPELQLLSKSLSHLRRLALHALTPRLCIKHPQHMPLQLSLHSLPIHRDIHFLPPCRLFILHMLRVSAQAQPSLYNPSSPLVPRPLHVPPHAAEVL